MARISERVLSRVASLAVVSAVALTGFTAVDYYSGNKARPPARIVKEWREVAKVGQRVGREDAKVTIVIFSDYQCGPCVKAITRALELQARNPAEVVVVLRHFPIPGNPFAIRAARSAICADNEGRFQEFNAAITKSAGKITDASITAAVEQAGLSGNSQFASCITAKQTDQTLADDEQTALRLQVNSTPTLLINGEQYVGARGLRSIVIRQLRS